MFKVGDRVVKVAHTGIIKFGEVAIVTPAPSDEEKSEHGFWTIDPTDKEPIFCHNFDYVLESIYNSTLYKALNEEEHSPDFPAK